MTCLAAGALGTRETVMAQAVDGTSAPMTLVWLAHRCPEAQSHGHSDGVIVQMKAQAGDGKSLQPGGGMRLCGGEETCSGHLVGTLQQAFLGLLSECCCLCSSEGGTSWVTPASFASASARVRWISGEGPQGSWLCKISLVSGRQAWRDARWDGNASAATDRAPRPPNRW